MIMLFKNTKIQILCARYRLKLGVMVLLYYMPNFNIYYKKSLLTAICDFTSVCSTSHTRQMGKPSPRRFECVVVSIGLMNRKSQNCGRSNKPGLERLQP